MAMLVYRRVCLFILQCRKKLGDITWGGFETQFRGLGGGNSNIFGIITPIWGWMAGKITADCRCMYTYIYLGK